MSRQFADRLRPEHLALLRSILRPDRSHDEVAAEFSARTGLLMSRRQARTARVDLGVASLDPAAAGRRGGYRPPPVAVEPDDPDAAEIEARTLAARAWSCLMSPRLPDPDPARLRRRERLRAADAHDRSLRRHANYSGHVPSYGGRLLRKKVG